MFSPLNMKEMKQRNQLWESKLPDLEKENQELKIKVWVQKQNLESVQWYIDVFENGQDTRQLAKLFSTT